MPLNALAESAAYPSGPAMWTSGRSRDGDAPEGVRGGARVVPAVLARLTATIVSIALPSQAGTALSPALAMPGSLRSSWHRRRLRLVGGGHPPAGRRPRPPGRRWATRLRPQREHLRGLGRRRQPGRASFFSAPVSLPDSGPASATTTSQNTRTSHLVRRPDGTPAIPRIPAHSLNPLVPVCPDPGETITRPVTHRRSPRHSGLLNPDGWKASMPVF